MKSLVLLAITIGGCSAMQAAEVRKPVAAHAHAYAVSHRTDNVNPVPAPLPSSKCDGSGYITHGDGHRTPCPGCDNCQKKSIIKPAVLTLVSQQCADGSCAAPVVAKSARTQSSGSCSSGSCGTSSAKATGPVRKLTKGIRERRPVRRLFGRLFGRR